MFISEIFETKSAVPVNAKQKQGPAGQARGTDKAPFRNKLVGEGFKLPGESDEDYLDRRNAQRKKVGPVINLAAQQGAKNKDEVRKNYNDTIGNRPVKADVGEAEERVPQHADADFAKPMFELDAQSRDINRIRPGAICGHPLIGMCKVVKFITGDSIDVVHEKSGRHFRVVPTSLTLYKAAPDLAEDTNPPDEITIDVPLLIRLLEYAREDAKTDMDLHNVAEQLIKLSSEAGQCLSMEQYDQIVGGMKEMAPGRAAYAGAGICQDLTPIGNR